MTEPFRVHVTAAGNGYLAESKNLVPLFVGGASPVEAAERARAIVSDMLKGLLRLPEPSTLIVRIDLERSVAFVMRPFAKTFNLTKGDPETLYVDSDGRSHAG